MRLAALATALAACAHAPAAPERRPAAGPPAVPPGVALPPSAPAGTAGAGSAARAPPAAGLGPAAPGPGAAERSAPSARQRLVTAARRHLGRPFAGDCSDFVARVHAEAGLRLAPLPARSASEGLWRATRPVQRPRPGDLAFFHDTFDRDGDGRRGDRFTHVALVESVDGPRVVLVHRGSQGVRRLPMNLSRRHDPAENGWLRKRRAGDPPGRFLSGELFAAYGTAVPGEPARRAAIVTQASPSGLSSATEAR